MTCSILNNLSITGPDKLSGFTSGSISGDESWYFRGQLNYKKKLSNKLTLTPYVYGATGVSYTLTPTATENRATAAKSIGLGLKMDGIDNYFSTKILALKLNILRIGLQVF